MDPFGSMKISYNNLKTKGFIKKTGALLKKECAPLSFCEKFKKIVEIFNLITF